MDRIAAADSVVVAAVKKGLDQNQTHLHRRHLLVDYPSFPS